MSSPAKGGGGSSPSSPSPSPSFKRETLSAAAALRKPGEKPSLQSILSVSATTQRVVAALKTRPLMRTAEQLVAITRVMRATRFFKALDPSDVEQLARHMRYQLAHPNAVLMQTGDESDKFFLVLRGSLQVLVNGTVVATKGGGDTFGEMALLRQGGEKRSADVIAMASCDLATLHRTEYLTIVEKKQKDKMALKRQLIQCNVLFRGLTSDQQESFSRCGRLQAYAGGSTIVQQGSPSEEIFLILKGSCVVTRTLGADAVGGRGGKSGALTDRSSRGGAGGGTTKAAPSAVELHVNVLGRGSLFGEVGVLHSVPRTASVVAELATECLVIARIELMRFFFDCPGLRSTLLDAAAKYPTDTELVRTWRYDDAWKQYKTSLVGSISRPLSARAAAGGGGGGGGRRGVPEPSTMPAFAPPRSAIGGGLFGADAHALVQHTHAAGGASTTGRMDEGSRLFLWANEYLDRHVLTNLDGLVVHTEYPQPRPPPGRRGSNAGTGVRRGSNAGAPPRRNKVTMVG
jgi:CRP-like cAMP-binding protein